MTTSNDTYTRPRTQAVAFAPRPTRAYPSLSLCRNCGEDYYPEDIPAELADVGQYGTCADCRAEFEADMAVWAVAS